MASVSRYRSIPRVPGASKDVLAIIDALETINGAKGEDNPNRALRLADLGLSSQKDIRDFVNRINNPEVPDFDDIIEAGLEAPTQPQNFQATASFYNVILEWDAADFGGYAYTSIYRSQTDNFGSSVRVGTEVGSLYADAVDVGQTYYYWIRFVRSDDLEGPLNATAGTEASTALVNASQIADAVIENRHLVDAAIDSVKLSNQAVTAAKLAIGAVQADIIAAGAVTETKISNNAITSPKIAANAVTASEILAGAVTANKIATSAITAVKISAGAITSDKIASNSVTTDKIAAGSITASSGILGDLSVTTAKLVDAAIITAKIANLAVDSAKIANGAIVNAKIGTAAVQTANIADANITTAKIQAAAITAAKIGAAQVDTLHLQDQTVFTPKYSSYVGTQIVNLAVPTTPIAGGSGISIGEIDYLLATGVLDFTQAMPQTSVVINSFVSGVFDKTTTENNIIEISVVLTRQTGSTTTEIHTEGIYSEVGDGDVYVGASGVNTYNKWTLDAPGSGVHTYRFYLRVHGRHSHFFDGPPSFSADWEDGFMLIMGGKK